MKKLVLAILFVSLIVGLIVFFVNEEAATDDSRLRETDKTQPVGSFNEPTKRKVNEEERFSISGKINEQTKSVASKDDSLTCMQKYQQQPEWKEIEETINSIYMNGEEAAGKGVYQQMPKEAVKSYADAGDKSAMLHYGSAVMWKSAFGVHINQVNRDPTERMENRKERIKKHKPDLKTFKRGMDYAYQAALLGKLGGIMEIASLQKGLLRRMARRGSSEQEIRDMFIMRHAYLNLMQKLHQEDSALLLFFFGEEELLEVFEYLYGDKKNKEKLLLELKSDIKVSSQKLIKTWEHDRRLQGVDIYPDIMPPKLDKFIADMETKCRRNSGEH